MKPPKTLKAWLKNYKMLADVSVCDLKGIEKLSEGEEYFIGAAMADIHNALSEELREIYETLFKKLSLYP